jgi:hypothetical protein
MIHPFGLVGLTGCSLSGWHCSARTMSPQDRRELLEMLHVRIFINRQGKEFRMESWFGPPIEGLSCKTSGYCAQKTVAFCATVALP